jgi:hypothetical protein
MAQSPVSRKLRRKVQQWISQLFYLPNLDCEPQNHWMKNRGLPGVFLTQAARLSLASVAYEKRLKLAQIAQAMISVKSSS